MAQNNFSRRQPVAPCRWRGGEHGQHRGAGERGSDDQGHPWLCRLCQRRHPQQREKAQRQRPVAADAAVAHDLQLALAPRPAAKTVGHVGQTILMHRSDNKHLHRHGEHGGGKRPDMAAQCENGRTDRSDQGADQRISP